MVYDITDTYRDDDGLWGVPSNLSKVFGTRRYLESLIVVVLLKKRPLQYVNYIYWMRIWGNGWKGG